MREPPLEYQGPSGMYCTATRWKAGGTGRAPEVWLTDLGLIGIGGGL